MRPSKLPSLLAGLVVFLIHVQFPEHLDAQDAAVSKPKPNVAKATDNSSEALKDGADAAADDKTKADAEKIELTEKEKSQQEEEKKKAAAVKKKQEEEKHKAERLKKINSLTFDRRPSAILKAWANPPQPKEEEKDGKADTQQQDTGKEDSVNETGETENGEKEGSTAAAIGSKDSSSESGSKTAGAKGESKPDPFDEELIAFQRNVTLSEWDQAEAYLQAMEEAEGKALYQRLVSQLVSAPAVDYGNISEALKQQLAQLKQMQQQRGQQREMHLFTFDDILALAKAAPMELEKQQVVQFGTMLRLALQQGTLIEQCTKRLLQVVQGDEPPVTKRQAAKILLAAGQVLETRDFLPEAKTAEQEDDFEGLNLLSQYYGAIYQKETREADLEQAWLVTQAVLAAKKTDDEQKQIALKRAVNLAPRVRKQLGQTWLNDSFTGQPQRGMDILATIGSAAISSRRSNQGNASQRLQNLTLQNTAVKAMLVAAPELADQWKATLNLLAYNWLEEATTTYKYDQSTSSGPSFRRDMYGNIFYANENQPYNQYSNSRINAISTTDLLEVRLSDAWLNLVDENIRPKFNMLVAQLLLKVNEEDQAFPYVERICQRFPDRGESLVNEFLDVWTRNHNPNAARSRTNYYMFMYGFERRAESIPLTRSKQQRNLEELSELVARLRKLPLMELDEERLAKAFTTCHSTAEVYQLKAIEKVFGSVEKLEPKTLAELIQKMRSNLATVWRLPATQENAKTKRKKKDIQAEVIRGYQVANEVLTRGLKEHPEDWSLALAAAAVKHDENDYRSELAPDSSFSDQRNAAFALFERAANLYKKDLPDLDEAEYSTNVYELWFYAALGAVDLGKLGNEDVSDLRQPAKIKAAMADLEGEMGETHRGRFANSLFTRMSAVKPAVKYRYLKSGFEIVGDHKRATEARKVFDYYLDLVTEIKLKTLIDGDDVVGHQEPFGLFVNLRHTKEIERESGGFGRYLQNQNSGQYYYNYGRPTENYREKFEETVQQALGEHFDILSVTFQKEDVNSKASTPYGWRVTPYAYILLKARGPEVDKIPPLRLDLDFLDTSGYAIIPVESPGLPLDASSEEGNQRPFQQLVVTQILDERQAEEGKLVVEVKASCNGLVPSLDAVLDFGSEGFEVVDTVDQGLSVSQFDEESDETLVVSERTWLVSFKASKAGQELPESFQFATPQVETKEVFYQRYVDADLASVDNIVSLEQEYGNNEYAWSNWLMLALGVIVIIGPFIFLATRSSQPQLQRSALPERITPFTVLQLLRQVERDNGFNEQQKLELAESIEIVEQRYFGARTDNGNGELDLEEIAIRWAPALPRSH